jgi:hypothetical protein
VSEPWTILSPVSRPPMPEGAAEVPGGPVLGRSISGVRVGLQVDFAWLCYYTLIDEWEKLLSADGAIPNTLWVERNRNEPRRDPTEVKAEVEEWAKLVECGVVGLGN